MEFYIVSLGGTLAVVAVCYILKLTDRRMNHDR